MSFDVDRLYRLLPAIYRVRDIEQGDGEQGGPIRALLAVIAGEIAVLEENLAQLYDDQFIETCAEWVVPYIGDLLGVRGLQAKRPGTFSQRSLVANTLAYRRRKGTALMLEQLARDATDWDAHVVECFQLLATTQSMHHLRPSNLAVPELRKGLSLERINTPFDNTAHTADVRRIASGRGCYNIPNIGIFLWRLQAHPLTDSPSLPFQGDMRRYTFSPLGNNVQLFTYPISGDEFTQLAAPVNVPAPISRRMLASTLDEEEAYYGEGLSLFFKVDGEKVPGEGQKTSERMSVRDLRDVYDESGTVSGWANMPEEGGKIAIDPVLGRLAFPKNMVPKDVRVTFHYGFSAGMGGGEYARVSTFDPELQSNTVQEVPQTWKTIQEALNAQTENGVVEITDNDRYEETLAIKVAKDQRIELRAADKHRPILVLSRDLQIGGEENAEVILNGLLISGGTLRVSGRLGLLRLRHCTLVPGLGLKVDSTSQHPEMPSLVLETETGAAYSLTIEIDHCITGPLRLPAEGVNLIVKDSIIDAPEVEGQPGIALAGSDDGMQPGPPTVLERTTVMGMVHVKELQLATDTLFTASVIAERWQASCVRFSYIPEGSQTPHRYRCQPDLAVQQLFDVEVKANQLLKASERNKIVSEIHARLKPVFTERNYGQPAYAQLDSHCPLEIRAGAGDGAEMGAFHDLYQPQRETNLRIRLSEYLRVGLEAGIFYAS